MEKNTLCKLFNIFAYKTEIEVNTVIATKENGLMSSEHHAVTILGDGYTYTMVSKNSHESHTQEGKTVDLISKLIGWHKVCEKYKDRYDKWKKSEGLGKEYVDQKFMLTHKSNSQLPFSMVEYMESVIKNDNADNKITIIHSDYGAGKTSFCKWFACCHAKKANEIRSKPLVFVFYLSENRTGSITEIIENQLSTEYGIPMSYSDYAELCQWGYFYTVLDGYDQTYGSHNMFHLEGDVIRLKKMLEGKGRLCISLRDDFYARDLHPLIEKRWENESIGVEYVTPAGFDKQLVSDYLDDRSSAIPEKQIIMNNIDRLYKRPLFLYLLANEITNKHDGQRGALLNAKSESNFVDIIYKVWIRRYSTNKQDEKDFQLAIRTMTHIALYSGHNRPVGLDVWEDFIKKDRKDKRQLGRERALEIINDFPLIAIDTNLIWFPVSAFLEYLWAKFVFEELQEHKSLIAAVEKSFIRSYKLREHVLTMVCEKIRKQGDAQEAFANTLMQLILCTRDAQHPNRYKYLGGNCLSILCKLWLESDKSSVYSNVIDKFIGSYNSFQRLNLMGADLRCADFSGCNFSYSTLSEADFTHANLVGTTFEHTRLNNIYYNTIWSANMNQPKNELKCDRMVVVNCDGLDSDARMFFADKKAQIY